MSLFSNNPELRACFESDAVRLIYQLQENLALLTTGNPAPEHVVTYQELIHTLRGGSSLVEVNDIADVCGDFMRLGEIADSCKHSSWDKAHEIFTFIQGHLDTLLQAVIHCLANEEAAATAICQPICAAARTQWKDYFYDANVTEAEGGFAAADAPPATPADAVSDFLSDIESGAVSSSSANNSSETVAGGSLDDLDLEGAPVTEQESTSDFLASMDDSTFLAAEPAAADAGTVEDFLGSVGEATEPAAQSTSESSDDFLSAMDEAPLVTALSESQSVDDFLGGLDEAPALPDFGTRNTEHAPAPAGFEAELLSYFYEDAEANLASLDDTLNSWEKNPSDLAAVEALHRYTHTIKGAARTTGIAAIGDLANSVEDLLEDAMEQHLACSPAALAALTRRMAECIRSSILELRASISLAANMPDIAALIEAATALRRGEMPSAPSIAFIPSVTSQPGPSAPASSFEADLLPFFYEDAFTNIESLELSLHNWEENPGDSASLQAVYRNTHTMKGAANSTGLADIGRMIHAVEDVLEDCVEKKLNVAPAALATLVYEMVDGIKAGIADLQTHGEFKQSLKTFAAIAKKAVAIRSTESQARPASRKKRRAAARAQSVSPETTGVTPIEALVPSVPSVSLVPSETPELIEPEADLAALKSAAPEAADAQTVRISSQRLDAVMNLIGELIISRTRLDKKILDISRLKSELHFCKTRLLEAISGIHERFEYSRRGNNTRSGSRSGNDIAALGLPAAPGAPTGNTDGFGDLEFDRYDEFNIMARSLVETGNDVSEVISQLDRLFASFTEESSQVNKATTNLQNEVTRIRMVPLTFLFRRLQRAVRDAATRESKDVEFRIAGGETQLDKNIVDEIYSPLLHLVRNSVSHGIESDDSRRRYGKASRGIVAVRAFQESSQVVIEVTDDGGGLNFAAIRSTAIERGLITADAQLSEDELTNLIFRAGFSTAKTVSQISGRGVGMDVVSNVVSRLNGSIEVKSHTGKGCVFTVRLPLTLAINQAMMISVSESKFALPLSFVEHIVPFRTDGVIHSGDAELWRTEAASIPLVRLDRVFGLPPAETKHANIVLVRVANKSLALLVDDNLTRQDIVVKPLGALLSSTSNLFSGATLSGDGDVILILDLPAIEQNFRNASASGARLTAAKSSNTTRPNARKLRRNKVLVVDDSLSVRKVAEKHLIALGYDTVLAVDGLDALEKLRTDDDISAVFTDLEMPRMHGYELIAEIRNSAAFRDLPITVVTSRDAEKHRKRAAELGANSYITKPFTREQLAQCLESLISTATVNA